MDKDEEQQFQSTSPTPKQPVIPATYLFFDAIKEVLNGRRITRQSWGNIDIYGYMREGVLCIYGGDTGDGKVHHWTLSEGDMTSDDWIILPEGN